MLFIVFLFAGSLLMCVVGLSKNIEFKIKCIIMLVVHQAALSDVMTMHFNVFQLIQLKPLDAAFIRNIA